MESIADNIEEIDEEFLVYRDLCLHPNIPSFPSDMARHVVPKISGETRQRRCITTAVPITYVRCGRTYGIRGTHLLVGLCGLGVRMQQAYRASGRR